MSSGPSPFNTPRPTSTSTWRLSTTSLPRLRKRSTNEQRPFQSHTSKHVGADAFVRPCMHQPRMWGQPPSAVRSSEARGGEAKTRLRKGRIGLGTETGGRQVVAAKEIMADVPRGQPLRPVCDAQDMLAPPRLTRQRFLRDSPASAELCTDPIFRASPSTVCTRLGFQQVQYGSKERATVAASLRHPGACASAKARKPNLPARVRDNAPRVPKRDDR